MDKLSDLELITAIAKIEGFDYTIRRDSVCPGDPTDVIVHKLTDVFDPLTDKAMLLDLIFDYGVSVCRDRDCVYIESDWRDRPHKSLVSFSGKEEFSRAALECIVEANNG